MAVHLTRISTRPGDAGQPRLGNNEVADKTDPRIAAYADTDECNAALGVALALGGLGFAAYLLYIQLAVLDAVCIWCVANDVVMALVTAAAVARIVAVGRVGVPG